MKIVSFDWEKGRGVGALRRGGIDVWEGVEDVVAWLEWARATSRHASATHR